MAASNQSRRRRNLIEWGFVVFLFVLCSILTTLQYRWTGEVSRAEAARLRAGLGEQAQALAREFDAELSEACAALKPARAELTATNREDALLARWRDGGATNARSIFRRIGVAVPSRGGVELLGLDEASTKVARTDWPADWSALREYVARMVNGGPPAFSDRTGEFMEFPIFGGRGAGPGTESGWLLLQLDMDYARNSWLPELVRSHLSFNGALPYNVTVTVASTGRSLYSTGADKSPEGEAVVSMRLHHQGRSTESSRGGRGGGPPGAPGGNEPVWILRAWPRPGALETIVSTSRQRNLTVAVAVNGLILAAGVALVFYTRRSRQLAEAQMNFVATVSHELRTPLTVIRGAGHNLLRGVVKEPEQIEEYSRLIIQHAEQLKELVEQTLTLAGASKARETMRRERVDLPALLNEAIAAVADDTQAAGCEVHIDASSSLPVVMGDAAALRRAFQNLLANAAKHGGDGRWISLAAESVNGCASPMIQVSVSDRGPGIPANEQAKLFKPFFRGANAQARQTRGSGLGLSVVSEIITAHGGSVSVVSEMSKGTTFKVLLPAQDAPSA